VVVDVEPSSNYFFVDKHGEPTPRASGASLSIFSTIYLHFF
jgi:hypothetical protein